jgi:hypothetical protein
MGGGRAVGTCLVPATCWAQLQARAFMHELGHALGLKHGGQDDVNDKPNHFSVMNYWYQFHHHGPHSTRLRTDRHHTRRAEP